MFNLYVDKNNTWVIADSEGYFDLNLVKYNIIFEN